MRQKIKLSDVILSVICVVFVAEPAPFAKRWAKNDMPIGAAILKN